LSDLRIFYSLPVRFWAVVGDSTGVKVTFAMELTKLTMFENLGEIVIQLLGSF
jgi:hypothetical protein